MAIAKIDKIEIIGLKEDRSGVLDLLQQAGIVEVNAPQEPSYGETSLAISPPLAADGGAEKTVSDADMLEIEEAIAFLSTFREKPGFFKGVVNLKSVVYREQLKDIITRFDHHSFLKELSGLRNHLKNLLQHKEKLNQERQLLTPWRKLGIPLDELHPTQYCGVALGAFYRRDYSKIAEDFKKEKIRPFFVIIDQDKVTVHAALIYIKEDFEKLQAVLKNYHFNFVTLSHHRCTAKERLFAINSEYLIFDVQIQDIKNKIANLLKEQFKLMAAYDYLINIKRREETDGNLIKQRYTFSLSGWIRHKDAKLLERTVGNKFKNLVLFISKPERDEEVPVALENNRIIQPFEFITKIYGFPKYNEIDPTPYLAPFFFLYFGFCVSDVGYGFMLAAISWLILKKFRMGPQGLRFFRLFLFCGMSTIIIGALTGGWFGNLFDLLADTNKIFLPLKKFKDSLIVLDPLKDPTKLLGIALSFGIVQVWFGNIIAGIGNIKNRRYLNVLLDQVTMLTFIFGLTGLGLIFLKLLDAGRINVFRYATIVGGLGLVLTQGRSEKGTGAKLFFGVYNLYSSLSGYLSDILSYSRLWALGLVTGVMASTINLISIQFSRIFVSVIPFIDKLGLIKVLISGLILIVIFVFGHSVSFLMNLLGAFVHPVRLQFVEFFSKFFKSGGNSFKPFKVETKYIDIR